MEVIADSPADDAGLKQDDVVIEFGGAEMRSSDQLRAAIRSHVPGDIVTVTYVRGSRTLTAGLTLAQRPFS